jgi:long-chain acyl-CoA synthetase
MSDSSIALRTYGADGRTVTRGALADLVDRRCAELAAAGVGPGDRVCLCLPNSAGWVATYLAIDRLRAVCVPLNAASAPDEIAHVLRDCRPKVALVPQHRIAALPDAPAERAVVWPDGRALPGRAVRVVEEESGRPDIAVLAYTSGTWGRPKGVLQPRSAVRLGGELPAGRLGIGAGDVVVSALPLAHTYGTNVLNAALGAGAALMLLERFDERPVLEVLRAAGPDRVVLAGVPAMFRRLLRLEDLPRVRYAVSAGQAATERLAAEWEARTGGAFVEGWGMTELAGMATLAAPGLPGRHGTAGTALPGVEVRVGTPIPDGTDVGELEVRGPMVMAGYLGAAEQTAAAMTGDGWLRTGDLGRIDGQGRVRVVSRLKEVVLSGGYTIYPAEVERVLESHPGIRTAAVAALPDPVRGEIAGAWVVAMPGTRLSADDVIEHCQARLTRYKLPRKVVFVTELPVTSNGKLRRRDLPGLLPC